MKTANNQRKHGYIQTLKQTEEKLEEIVKENKEKGKPKFSMFRARNQGD